MQASGVNPYRYTPLDGRPRRASATTSSGREINLPVLAHASTRRGGGELPGRPRGLRRRAPRDHVALPSRRGGDGRRCSCSFSPARGRPRRSSGSRSTRGIRSRSARSRPTATSTRSRCSLWPRLLAAWQARRFALAGAAVALAALVKLGPFLLVPALARRGGRRFVAAGAPAAPARVSARISRSAPAVFGDLRRLRRAPALRGQSLVGARAGPLGDDRATTLLARRSGGRGRRGRASRARARSSRSRARACSFSATLLLVVSLRAAVARALAAALLRDRRGPGVVVADRDAARCCTCSGSSAQLPIWVRPVVYGPLAAWALWRLLAARRPAVVALPAGSPVAGSQRSIPTLDEAESLPRCSARSRRAPSTR